MNSLTLGACFKEKNNNFNLMRLLAAFAVIYGHASAVTGKGPPDLFLQLVGYKFIGGVAVDLFFVISGFLVTASAMSRNGLLYYSMSRLLRIYPGLIVCVLFTVFFIGPVFSDVTEYWSSFQTWKYLFNNATAFRTEYFLPGVFLGLHDSAVNGSLWSLAIEVRLYLLLLLMALFGIIKNRALFNLLFFLVIVTGYLTPSIFSTLFTVGNHQHVAMMFMIGSFAWVNREMIHVNPGILLLLLFFAASQHGTSGFGVAYSILLPYAVFYLAFSPGGAWFNRFGDYSYGVYLYGWLSQQLVLVFMPQASNTINAWLGCLVALVFAAISWHLIEAPALRLKKRFRLSPENINASDFKKYEK